MRILAILLPILISFFISYITTVWVIRQAKKSRFVGKDINKPDKPEIPLLGGIGIIAGFIAGSFSLLLTDVRSERVIPAVILSSLLIAFLGLLDDIFNVRQSVRAFLPIFASVPLIVYSVGHSIISIPFLGPINFGIFYYIIIIPFALTITSNAFNMLEGLNGLGVGMGIIMLSALAYIGLTHTGPTYQAGLIALSAIFSLSAFLIFNKYPAKIFPGNVGTYFIGALIGAIGIAGFMYTALAILYIPYVVEFILKLRTNFKGVSFGKVDSSGRLYWDEKPHSLTHIVMKMGRFKEYQVVIILWGMEAIFAVIAVILQTTTIVI
ncbi:UDP-N-acetylglucosamine--dolichyl-phosphate N-acetylglucosaminephosphotransferase [Saccharolobus solfataricus]|uniref:Putative UDP-N-acetylglucosamine--dolichyl-phosphate N-acetylglucosaminephosphotransferase n=3 Tax=Saccharolobus solfataricus TaxID=2287 RepID=GPT_SACS2|nr:glycosyltransferase 4 family protein [Saccharolobus solfataricus]P96000.1 RecName: Full=Putative UDP-N-acetylglucosamine--dolichyl-phosphate N-acetylglucosaminephosphotransferase; AltName: Full=GlcNAc-1-P transferase; Short=G1PT; Short=GPT; AltName: Full=N-acetylglucosamine-1-phosphate transferase [Saccharolobus solfataricus P2]AAK40422.1 UDP-N-acetylglucosamine--dolichyl-phosphate N-acetylglucosaminephosphotransferase (gnptA) [Saccharolobus solfataricus P2]AKA73410.1 UDP-N-acetylglucosamine-